MKMKIATALCTLIIFLSAPAQAEEEKPKKKWIDEAELSFVDTSGNSETSTFAAKNLLKIKFTDKLEGEWDIAALKSQSTDKTTDRNKVTAERYSTNLKLSYLFTERFYSGLGTGWSRDEFAGLQNKNYVGAFVGYKFLTGPKHLLKGELGLNYVNEDYTKNKELKNFKDKDFVEGRAFGLYEYALTEKTKFSQSIEYLGDFDDPNNYKVNSLSALTVAISDIFSIKPSYEIHYVNKVPVDINTTDRIVTVALVANF
jgi:putative salt-induced outer membrane protein